MNRHNRLLQKGASMIEVMLSLAVVGVGMLTVAHVQTGIFTQVGDNKARVEATVLAQARIEDMRNYTNLASDRAAFDSLLAATQGYTNDTQIDGVNADFLRQESVTDQGTIKIISARVSWTDQLDVSRDVVVSSEITWISPKAPGQKARLYNSSVELPSPTGRVKPGVGDLSDLPEGTVPTPNGDGTSEVVIDNIQYLLAGGEIVLILENVCGEEGCVDFTRINGRVYIDRRTKNNIPVGDVNVIASNNAYCSRYYYTSDGSLVVIDNDTDQGVSTLQNGDYEYFNFVCYVGGGWYGNIGVHVAGGNSQNDKVCMGDPNSTEAWSAPTLSSSRIYRGFVYQIDPETASGKAEDSEGNPIYWSIGVPDSAELGLYRDSLSGELIPMHNFVVSSLPVGADSGEDCIQRGVLVREDSNVKGVPGDLFNNVPGDFICLNPDVDSFDPEIYGVEESCPNDPS